MNEKKRHPVADQHYRQDIERIARLRARLATESSDSLKLLEDINENPVCSVTFDKSIPAIVVIWRQYATSAQLRYIHESILHLVEKYAVCKILGDDSHLPTIHAEDRTWIVENWMPRAIAGGLRFAASKTPESHFGKVSVSSIQAVAPTGLVTRSFDKIDDAKRWLQGVCSW